MTLISYFAVFLSILGFRIGMPRMTFSRLFFVASLLVVHIATSVLYYMYTLSHLSDTYVYYYDPWNLNYLAWYNLGTAFIVHVTQFFKHSLGATYFDCFMIFQIFGFWGVMALLRIFDEIHARAVAADSVISKYLLFLPGLHFWTAGLGKDGLMFFAIALCTLSALKLSSRTIQFGLGLLLLVFVRAHIAVAVVASLVIAVTLHRRLSLGKRLALLVPAVGALVIVAVVLEAALGIDLADPHSIEAFYVTASANWGVGAGNLSLYNQPLLVKLVSLLARPMFFDAQNALGLIASIENVALLLVIAYCLVHYRQLFELYRNVYFIRFSIVLTVSLILLLAIVNYNIGLGLRQRTMFLPPLLSIFVAIWAFRQRLGIGAGMRRPPAPHLQMAPPGIHGALDKGASV